MGQEVGVAGRGDPTFLKRQKEMKRVAKANAKRAAQQARREEKAERAKMEGQPEEQSEVLHNPTDEESSGPS